MCSAQPVITRALMWSLGAAEASYYCRFMTTLTQTAPSHRPSSFPSAHSYYTAQSICLPVAIHRIPTRPGKSGKPEK